MYERDDYRSARRQAEAFGLVVVCVGQSGAGLMTKKPKRPADVVSNAVHVMRIATGEIMERAEEPSAAAKLGSKGGKARAASLGRSKRVEIAKRAAAKRWNR